jgi:uncharacterized OB-fold protein
MGRHFEWRLMHSGLIPIATIKMTDQLLAQIRRWCDNYIVASRCPRCLQAYAPGQTKCEICS